MAAKPFTFEHLKKILVDRVGLPEEDVVEDMSADFESMGLDSLALVEIQAALQQDYGFMISDEDAQRITTIGEAIDYTNQKIQEGN